MAEYIDRNFVYSKIRIYADACYCAGSNKEGIIAEKIEGLIKEIPAADVVERKRGKWMEWLYPAEECGYCTECGTRWYHEDLYMGGNDFPKFCPECGAVMENWKSEIEVSDEHIG